MAEFTTSLAQLSTLLKQELVQSGEYQARLLSVLRVQPAFSTVPTWSVDGYGGESAFNFGENGGLASSYTADTQHRASLGWGQYGNAKDISHMVIAQAALSPSPSAMQDVVLQNLRKGVAAITKAIGADLFSGLGSNRIVGLDSAIGDHANDYAGIDRLANAFWRPMIVDPGSPTAITLALMRKDMADILQRSGKEVDLIVTTPAILNTIKAFGDGNFSGVYGSAQAPNAVNFGPKAVFVEGVPVIADPRATAGRVYYINRSALALEYLPMPASDMVSPLMVPAAAKDMVDQMLLPLAVQKLPSTTVGVKFAIVSTCQLVVTEPFSCGVRKNAT